MLTYVESWVLGIALTLCVAVTHAAPISLHEGRNDPVADESGWQLVGALSAGVTVGPGPMTGTPYWQVSDLGSTFVNYTDRPGASAFTDLGGWTATFIGRIVSETDPRANFIQVADEDSVWSLSLAVDSVGYAASPSFARQQLVAMDTTDKFYRYQMQYNPGTDRVSVWIDGSLITQLNRSDVPVTTVSTTRNKIVFGAAGSSLFGVSQWNFVSLELGQNVPEPTMGGLIVVGGLVFGGSRKRFVRLDRGV